MKKWLIIIVVLPAAIFALMKSAAEPPRSSAPRPARELMRQKLHYSQGVLEAIAVEDWDLLARNAKSLGAIMLDPSWPTFDIAEYSQQSVLFKRNVDALEKAAREKNIDSATLSYFRVTLSCVECHKTIRTKKVATQRAQ